MNERERWVETLRFGEPDRIPFEPGTGRESTLRRWRSEGLPPLIEDVTAYAYVASGGSLELPPRRFSPFFMNHRMIPEFEEKVIERRERTLIVQDWKGNVCEISDSFDPEHLRNASDFVTRRWIRCPVESRVDWPGMKARYDPENPARLPENPEPLGQSLETRNFPIEINVHGPFWQMREWLGFEALCMLFYDDEAFLSEMLEFWTDYVERLLRKTLSCFVPDSIRVSEDMAYKAHQMISPAMVRRYLVPTWRRWGELVRGAGCPIFAIDSDGFVEDLVPDWIDSGFNACDPVEAAAHNDIARMRRRFGAAMSFRGGIDKRAIAGGGRGIEEEIARIAPVAAMGGFIPGCDHGVPSDVSWPDFVRYLGLLAKVTGWA